VSSPYSSLGRRRRRREFFFKKTHEIEDKKKLFSLLHVIITELANADRSATLPLTQSVTITVHFIHPFNSIVSF
jgi:hypothetical protein